MNDTTSSSEPISRQERRELRRAEQKSGQSSSGRRRFLRRLLLWGGGLAVLVFIGWGMTRLAANVKLPSDSTTLTVPVSDSDHIWGPASASLTLLEYGDYQCPACAAYHSVVQKVLQETELAGKIRFVFRNFPLTMHQNARLAAAAAESAAVEGKFWEMHDKLYEEQEKWSGFSGKAARDAFMEYARGLSINTEWFAGDLDSDKVAEKIDADVQGGVDAGVDSTPTFYVNGARMPQVASYEEFKQYLIAHVATP